MIRFLSTFLFLILLIYVPGNVLGSRVTNASDSNVPACIRGAGSDICVGGGGIAPGGYVDVPQDNAYLIGAQLLDGTFILAPGCPDYFTSDSTDHTIKLNCSADEHCTATDTTGLTCTWN